MHPYICAYLEFQSICPWLPLGSNSKALHHPPQSLKPSSLLDLRYGWGALHQFLVGLDLDLIPHPL